MPVTIDSYPWAPGVNTSLTVAGWSGSPACPYCGAWLRRSGGMGERDGRYEWRDVEECPACGWRREEIRSVPLGRVYGKEV